MMETEVCREFQQGFVSLQAAPEGGSELTIVAYDILITDLEARGNKLGARHKLALYELLAGMTGFALGYRQGRYVYPLATGSGKTSAIIAWVTALHRLGMNDVSVSVSAFTVAALCDIKKQLIAHGVPEEFVGIKHTDEKAGADCPSTGNHDRRYQLVTHARVRGGRDGDLFMLHQGKARALMIYDESLLKSDAHSIQKNELMAEIRGLQELVKDLSREPLYGPLLTYLGNAGRCIEDGLYLLKSRTDAEALTVSLPPLTVDQLEAYLGLMKSYPRHVNIRELLDISQYKLRIVFTSQGGGVVGYELGIPDELENILILDASYPIRKLCQLDSSILQGGRYGENIKRFDHVIMHSMKAPSGRCSIENSFRSARKEDRNISREIIEVIKQAGKHEAILIFTFKQKSGQISVSGRLKADLLAAGIDVDAKLPDGAPRINILTWGQETSLNGYSHCRVVILAGVLNLPHLAIASKIVGQRDDLQAEAGNSQISEVQYSEQAHMIYQAVSRGHCRTVTDGQANPMKIFMMHTHPQEVKLMLGEVMPGLKWRPWDAQFNKKENQTKQGQLVSQMLNFLKNVPGDVTKVLTKEMRSEVLGKDADSSNSRLFSRAVQQLLEDCYGEWYKEGHSLMRLPSLYA